MTNRVPDEIMLRIRTIVADVQELDGLMTQLRGTADESAELDEQMGALRESVGEVSEALREANQGVDITGNGARRLEEALREAERQAQNLAGALGQADDAAAGAGDALGEAAGGTEDLGEAAGDAAGNVGDLGEAAGDAAGDVGDLGDAAGDAGDDVGDLGEGMGDAAGAGDQLEGGLTRARLAVAALAAGLATAAVTVGRWYLDVKAFNDALAADYEELTGSTEAYAEAQEFVEEVASRSTVAIDILQRKYYELQKRTQGLAVDQNTAKRAFAAVAAEMGRLGKSADDVDDVLGKLNDILANTESTAGDVIDALGDHMPGALRAFADAAGVSVEQARRLVDEGKLLATDVLPALASQLDQTFDDKGGATGLESTLSSIRNELRLMAEQLPLLDRISETATAAAAASAEKTLDVLRQLRGESNEAEAALDRLRRPFDDVGEAADKMEGPLRRTEEALADLGDEAEALALNELSQGVREASEAVDTWAGRLADARQTLRETTAAQGENSEATRQAALAVKAATDNYDAAFQAARRLANELAGKLNPQTQKAAELLPLLPVQLDRIEKSTKAATKATEAQNQASQKRLDALAQEIARITALADLLETERKQREADRRPSAEALAAQAREFENFLAQYNITARKMAQTQAEILQRANQEWESSGEGLVRILDMVRDNLRTLSDEAAKAFDRRFLDSYTYGFTAFAQTITRVVQGITRDFEGQRQAFDELVDGLARGDEQAVSLAGNAEYVKDAFNLLGQERLDGLRSALDDAIAKTRQLREETERAAESARDRLDRARGDAAAIRERENQREIERLEALLEQARARGDEQAIADAEEALALTRQAFDIERQREAEKEKGRNAEREHRREMDGGGGGGGDAIDQTRGDGERGGRHSRNPPPDRTGGVSLGGVGGAEVGAEGLARLIGKAFAEEIRRSPIKAETYLDGDKVSRALVPHDDARRRRSR